jgi:RHS repeat-associated protein
VKTASTRRTALHAGHSVSIFVLLLSLAAAALFSATVEATVYSTGAVGRTKGSFTVSSTGAATYTIPIWAPPGPRGVTPQIALSYNSQGGNGYLGVGWGISGLSSIYRCNLTFAQDAAPAPVALATGDGYCLDGQRLRLTSGTYGAAGSTYQTEIANFANVEAEGTAGNGPEYWVVVDRNGVEYTYGGGGSATNAEVLASGTSTAIAWELSEVNDPYGNTMTIAYNLTTGSTPCISAANLPAGLAVPCTISWTPASHESGTYNYTMNFYYGTNSKPVTGYVAGTSQSNPGLLTSIVVAYSGATVRTTYLTYSTSSTTGNETLADVQECAGSGTSSCLAPTVITYQSGTEGVSTTATSLAHSVTAVHYDFNGDGYPDLLYLNGSTYYVSFGSATGFGTGVSTGIPSTATQVLPGSLLGINQDGILAAVSGTWYYYNWNGSSFTKTSTGLAYDSTAVQYLLADVNGDGLPDLIASYFSGNATNGYTFTIDVHLNTGAGSSVSFGSAIQAYQILNSLALAAEPQLVSNTDNAGGQTLALGSLRRFDFNGDGRDDLAMQEITQTPLGCGSGQVVTSMQVQPLITCTYKINTFELISGGSTSSPAFTGYLIYQATASNEVPVAFLDFNSDACTDYIVGATVYIAGCNGTTPSEFTLGNGNVIGAMDWNGDGLTDILVANGSTVGVYLSTGTGVSNLVSTSIPYSSDNLYFTLDANGDGLDDFGYSTGSDTYYYLHNGAGTPSDLLTSVTDGFGNSASPTYVSLVQSDYAKTGYGTAAYPYQTFMAPMYVVNKAVYSDPSSSSGGTYNQTFSYYEAWANVQGRGFQAFYNITSVDSRTGLTLANEYQRTFPGTGMLLESYLQNSSFNISLTENTLTTNPLSSTEYQERYFTYVSSSTTQQKEVGGTENGDLITTTSSTYAYDNYGNATTIATTVKDNDPGSPNPNPYLNDTWTTTITNTPETTSPPTGLWCTSLFTESQVAYTSTAPGSTAVTVTKTFTPDTTHCDYTQIVTQSNSGASYAVTEGLAYDSFGNVATGSVSAPNVVQCPSSAPCTTSINWGTTGQFPMSVTDPTNAMTQYNYNFNYGEKSSATDPNGITTSWQYDAFGRKNQEIRPDGTYTQWTYLDMNNYGYSNHGVLINSNVYASNGTAISGHDTGHDPIGRFVLQVDENLSGGYNQFTLSYDSLGRVASRSFPCAFVSWPTTCAYSTTNSHDVLNRLTQSQRPISSTNSNLQTTSYAYAGRTTTVTDALSNTRTLIHDVNGWLRQTQDPYNYKVTLAYDAAGNKTAVSDSSGNALWSATYSYGIAAFPASVTDMDRGTWSPIAYDALGELTSWTDAKGQSFSETYDALSRPLTRKEPDYFTQWTWGSSAASHNIGKLQSVCTGTGSSPTSCTGNPGYAESETYDSDGRQSQRTITLPGANGTFTYTWAYNATTGLLNTLTYPASYPSTYSLQLQYAYSYGYLQSVTDVSDTPNVPVWTNDAMNPAGQVTEESLGNGVVTNRNYDAVTAWLGTDQSGVGGGYGLKNLAFLYDEMGDVTQRQDNNLGLTENAFYDNDYRLTSTTLGGTQNLSVTYDNTMGNITSRSDVAGGATWTYSSTQKHAVTQAGSSAYAYSYDANGNATARQGDSITWTSYNYPVTVNAGSGSTAEAVAFSYGPDRMRWQQMYTGNGTNETTNYVGGLLEVVSSGSVTDYRHYIYAGAEPVAVYSRKTSGVNTFSYLLSDHQGSLTAIINSSGTPVVNESFTPFGNRRNALTWSGPNTTGNLTEIAGVTREGYTFQTALGLWMGMNHMNGRVEDAVTGRMLSADPNIPDPTNAQSYNRYSYVNNNPLTLTDPSGFCTPAWTCKQDAGSGLGQCRECGGSDPGDAGFNNSAMQQFAAISADPDQGFLAGLDDIASSLANPIDQSRGCLIGCSATIDTTPPPTCDANGENCLVTVCASCKVTISTAPPPDLSPPPDPLGNQPQITQPPQGSQVPGWVGIGATAGQYSSGTSAIGTNLRLYSAPRGNQYFSTLVEVGNLFKTLGIGALVAGTAFDYYDALQTGSFGQANLNLGIGLAGLASPIYAVPAAVYFVSSTYYPGGPAAYNAAFSQQLNAAEGGGQ